MIFQNIRARVQQHLGKNTDAPALPKVTSMYQTERRKGHRVEVETLLTAITKDGSRFQGYCRNLSQEGTAAIVWGELKVGEEVCLAFRSLGCERETIIPAIVRNSISHRYGFEFAVTDEAELHSLLMDACRIEATYS